MGRSLEELAAEKGASYEIKLRLGTETYKKFDGCPFPLESTTEDEQDVDHVADHQIFFIEFNRLSEESDQRELLEWFHELTKPPAKEPPQSKEAPQSKETPQADSSVPPPPPPPISKERNALLFPASISKQHRALWHKLAQDAHLRSQSEGFGAARALRITPATEVDTKSRWGRKSEGEKPRGNNYALAVKAKRIWRWCQEEGGECMNYSQGEIQQLLQDGLAMPPELARLCGKRDMADRLFKAIGQKDERRAMALLEKDRSLAWVKDNDTGGFPIHYAAWHGIQPVVAMIIEQKTALKQKDKQRRTALGIAEEQKHESIIQLLLAAEESAKEESPAGKDAPSGTDNGKADDSAPSDQPHPDKAAPIEPILIKKDRPVPEKAIAAVQPESRPEKAVTGVKLEGKPESKSVERVAVPTSHRVSAKTATGSTAKKPNLQSKLQEIEAVVSEWGELNEQTAVLLEQLGKHQRIAGSAIQKLAALKIAIDPHVPPADDESVPNGR